jgi:hypothetical protein
MNIELATGIIWLDQVPLFQQPQEVQDFIWSILGADNPVILAQEDEDCLGGYTRPKFILYQLTAEYAIRYTPIYVNPPMSSAWGSASDYIYAIEPVETE